MQACKAENRSGAEFSWKSPSSYFDAPQTRAPIGSHRSTSLLTNTAYREIPCAVWKAIPDGERWKLRIASRRHLVYLPSSRVGVRPMAFQGLVLCEHPCLIPDPVVCVQNRMRITQSRPCPKGAPHGCAVEEKASKVVRKGSRIREPVERRIPRNRGSKAA